MTSAQPDVCLVCLVSDQTLPNILATLHFTPDFLLFISTQKMEEARKTQAILRCLKERGPKWDYESPRRRWEVLQVPPESVLDIQQRVGDWLAAQTRQGRARFFLVNLTGGTKVMALSAYDLFSQYRNRMVYLPIDKNEVISPFPKMQPDPPEAIQTRLSVAEYLLAYGLEIPNRRNWERAKDAASHRDALTSWVFEHFRELSPFLAYFHENFGNLDFKKKKSLPITLAFPVDQGHESIKQFWEKLGWEGPGEVVLTKELWRFLRGGWLEEYLFFTLSEGLPPATSLEMGVQVRQPHGASNEYDLLFTYRNALHIIECKSLGAGAEGAEASPAMDDFLYKLTALRQDFGLTPKIYLATTDESILDSQGELLEKYRRRIAHLRVEIIPLLQVPDLVEYFRRRFPPEKA